MADLKYFKESEFRCPCCGENNTDENLMKRVDAARGLAGVPFVITSGYRCEKHNTAVGGKTDSAHTKGLAFDVAAVHSRERKKILKALFDAGFTRIGIAKEFIHADMDETKDADVVWLY